MIVRFSLGTMLKQIPEEEKSQPCPELRILTFSLDLLWEKLVPRYVVGFCETPTFLALVVCFLVTQKFPMWLSLSCVLHTVFVPRMHDFHGSVWFSTKSVQDLRGNKHEETYLACSNQMEKSLNIPVPCQRSKQKQEKLKDSQILIAFPLAS